jgi:hypothetical protein
MRPFLPPTYFVLKVAARQPLPAFPAFCQYGIFHWGSFAAVEEHRRYKESICQSWWKEQLKIKA